jgi:hypothetical protein
LPSSSRASVSPPRLGRLLGGAAEEFQAVADREVRRKLIDNCQCIILCGVGEPVEEITP